MSLSWINSFQNFARTIDFVDDDLFKDVKDLMKDFFKRTLEISFFRVSIDGYYLTSDDGDVPALNPIWSSHLDRLGDIEIFSREGKCNGLEAYAYHRRKRLWLIATDGRQLQQSTNLIDKWSGSKDLPAFSGFSDENCKTCIILPLVYGGRHIGVMNAEFEDQIDISGQAKKGALALADGISRIIWLHKTNEVQAESSREAFRGLVRSAYSYHSPFTRRKVFLANSKHADKDVICIIKEVLKSFELFELAHWEDETASGNVSEQVRTSIMTAEFGVCYLSEPIPDTNPIRYRDNSNVLFEAGMFQMVHEMRDAPGDVDAARWIPIRENPMLTTSVPFDISGDRIIHIPRIEGTSELNKAEFEKEIREAVNGLVQSLEID